MTASPLFIGRETELEELKRHKISRLYIPKGMSCCPVLIHVNGVSDSVIDSGYFTEIIDFCDALN